MNPEKMLKDLDELYIEYNDTTEFENYRIEVQQDFDPLNPRKDFDNLGTMVCWHNRYDLGDIDGSKEYSNTEDFWFDLADIEDNGEEEDLERAVNIAHANHIILPLYLYDHSGITMNTSGFTCPWDSGQVGFIYISLEKAREEYGWKRITKKRREQLEKMLTAEVKEYDYYLTGSIYGFSIEREDPDGEEEHVDSCWGFFGDHWDDDGYMISVIKDAIKYDIEHTPAQLDLI